jgi:hypothetical protein
MVPATPMQDTPATNEQVTVQPGILLPIDMESHAQLPNVLDDDLFAGTGTDRASQLESSRNCNWQKST